MNSEKPTISASTKEFILNEIKLSFVTEDKQGIIKNILSSLYDKINDLEINDQSVINNLEKNTNGYVSIANHINYQPEFNNFQNIHNPFEHTPEDGECDNTIDFLKHIFGCKDIKYKHFRTNEEVTVNELDLALDYIQLLYQYPTHKLPILCLVSKENETGKSTFALWLRALFTQNVAIVGNTELADNFNASWASKLLVICDEAKIDFELIRKINEIQLADSIIINKQCKDPIEIDFYGKFILLSNNESNFPDNLKKDRRYWIRKLPKVMTIKRDLFMNMKKEIPAFLMMLNQRTIKTRV